jgi:hypothetical protein
MNKGRHKEPIIAQPMSSLVPFVLQFTRPAVNSRLTDPASQPTQDCRNIHGAV